MIPDDTWLHLWLTELVAPAAYRRGRRDDADPIALLAEALQRAGDRRHPHDVLTAAAHRAERALRGAGWRDARFVDVETEVRDAPTAAPWLVLAGDAPLRAAPAVGIVGTRDLDASGLAEARALIAGIVANLDVRIVSGGAIGVDAVAQDEALRAGRDVALALAGGLGHPSPRCHAAQFRSCVERGGLIVTERPPQCPPQRYEFVRRNRWIAWMSDVVVVVRAPRSSGALATATAAEMLGRPVLAVPGAPRDDRAEGCHELLRNGAKVCTSWRDVAGALRLGEQLSLARPRPERPRATTALQHALDLTGGDLQAVAQSLGLGMADLLASLLAAELDGGVARDPSGRWRSLH